MQLPPRTRKAPERLVDVIAPKNFYGLEKNIVTTEQPYYHNPLTKIEPSTAQQKNRNSIGKLIKYNNEHPIPAQLRLQLTISDLILGKGYLEWNSDLDQKWRVLAKNWPGGPTHDNKYKCKTWMEKIKAHKFVALQQTVTGFGLYYKQDITDANLGEFLKSMESEAWIGDIGGGCNSTVDVDYDFPFENPVEWGSYMG